MKNFLLRTVITALMIFNVSWTSFAVTDNFSCTIKLRGTVHGGEHDFMTQSQAHLSRHQNAEGPIIESENPTLPSRDIRFTSSGTNFHTQLQKPQIFAALGIGFFHAVEYDETTHEPVRAAQFLCFGQSWGLNGMGDGNECRYPRNSDPFAESNAPYWEPVEIIDGVPALSTARLRKKVVNTPYGDFEFECFYQNTVP